MDDQPPSPPDIAPKLRFFRTEMIGMPLIALLPILAIAGLFGPSTASAEGRIGAVQWSIEHPSVTRYENRDRLELRLSNSGDSAVSELTVAFDPEWIHAFAPVSFEPAPETPYVVDVGEIGPGETRLVVIELTAEQYGKYQGRLVISDGAQTAIAPLETFIFP